MSRMFSSGQPGQQSRIRSTGQKSWRRSGFGGPQQQQQQQFYDDDLESTSSSSTSTTEGEEEYGYRGRSSGVQGRRSTSVTRGGGGGGFGAYGQSGYGQSGFGQNSGGYGRTGRMSTGRRSGRLQGLLDTEDEEFEGQWGPSSTGGRFGQLPRRNVSKRSRSRGMQQGGAMQQGYAQGYAPQQGFASQKAFGGRKSGSRNNQRKQRGGGYDAAAGGGDSSEEETWEILRDLQLDRERDLFQISVAQDLLRDRRVNRNVHDLCDALSEGRKVPVVELHELLCEDALLDAAVDDVILEILEDKQSNRKADEIIRNLGRGRRHLFRTQDPNEEAEDEQHDRRIAKVARKLMTPDAGKKLCKMFGHSTGQHPFQNDQQQQQVQPLQQPMQSTVAPMQQSSGISSGKRISSSKPRSGSAVV